MKITVFGAGAYGAALGKILEDNGHSVVYYDPIKYPDINLTTALDGSDASVIATPSAAVSKIVYFIPKDKPVICASKGMLSAAQFSAFGENFSMLSGGAFAADMNNQKATTLTVTSEFAKNLFANNWITFDQTTDHYGVMLCGAFKNVYAIGSGLWQLQYGTPDFDDFINKSLGEMRTILAANGCDPNTVNLSCGLNDLVLTAASTRSRNYAFGAKIRQIPTLGADVIAGRARINNTVEGLNTIIAMTSTPGFKRPAGLSLLDHIYSQVTATPLPDLPVPGVTQ